MKKTRTLFALLFVLLLSLSACSKGSYTVVVGDETNQPTEKAMVYQAFSGHKSYEFTVKEGEEITINVSVVTEEGEISAYIAKDNDVEQAVYEGTAIPTSDFTVTIKESGTYVIRVDAKQHKGSYSFTW